MKLTSILLLSSFAFVTLPKFLNVRPRPLAVKPPAPAMAPPERPPQPTVEVIHGIKRTINTVSAASSPEPKQ
jgi:hypothetical protein